MVDCSSNDAGCNGGNLYYTLSFVKNNGLVNEDASPPAT